MIKKHPKVSILIPTYNYAHHIEEAIESVLAQTYTDFELIIVDDYSTDNTAAVVEKYLNDNRISFIKNPKNLGLTANFNRCLELANGEFIKYLLADDKFDHQLLQKFVDVMEQYPELSLVTSNSYQFGEVNRLRTLPLQGFHTGLEVIKKFFDEGLKNWIGEPTTVMFRKADIEKVGIFDVKYHLLVDIDMWIRLLSIGDCFIYSEPLSYNRKHDMQASQVILSTSKFYFESYEFTKAFKNHKVYDNYGSTKKFQETLKRRASKCVKQSIKLLPQIYDIKKRPVIKKGLKIGMDEGVILTALLDTIRNKTSRNKKSSSILN